MLKDERENLDSLIKSMKKSQDLFLIETNCTLDKNNYLNDYLPLCYNAEYRSIFFTFLKFLAYFY